MCTILYILSPLIYCSEFIELESNWYREYLTNETTKKMSSQFDFIPTQYFIGNQLYSESFSPLALDYNFPIQRANGYFAFSHIGKAQKELLMLNNKLNKTNRKTFNIINRLDIEDPLVSVREEREYYLHNTFFNKEKCNRERAVWTNSYTNLLIKPIDQGDFSFIDKDSIITIAYFNGSLFMPFEKEKYFRDWFHVGSLLKDSKTYKQSKAAYKYYYGNILGVNLYIVAVSYKATNSKGFIRYIVYLVPTKEEKQQLLLKFIWQAFYD